MQTQPSSAAMVEVIGNSGHTDQMTQLLRLFDKIGLVWDDTRDVRDGTKAKHDDPNEDRILTEDSLFHNTNQISIEDWSQTGRGTHIDFSGKESVPLEQDKQFIRCDIRNLIIDILGLFLGRGATGDVHEVTVQGCKLAHKKIFFNRRVGEKEKKEIKILTKLSHVHTV
jgi:hypothetical protein